MKIINLYRKIYQPHQLSNKYKKVDDYLLRGPHPGISDLIIIEQTLQEFDFFELIGVCFKYILIFLVGNR